MQFPCNHSGFDRNGYSDDSTSEIYTQIGSTWHPVVLVPRDALIFKAERDDEAGMAVTMG